MDDLFRDLDAFLEQHKERMRDRAKFQAAMQVADFHDELWDSIRPFVRTPDEYRAAADFMLKMLRSRE